MELPLTWWWGIATKWQYPNNDNMGVPFGINFGGLKGTEPKLIHIASGFEQATKIRKPPTFKSKEINNI